MSIILVLIEFIIGWIERLELYIALYYLFYELYVRQSFPSDLKCIMHIIILTYKKPPKHVDIRLC